MPSCAANPDKIRPNTMKKFYKVVDTWLENGYDAISAYQSVYPNASRTTASCEFAQIKKIPKIAEYIKRREKETYDSLGITLERLYGELAKMAFNPDPDYPQAIKAKTVETLIKNLKEDAGRTTASLNITIGVDEDDEDNSEEECI